MAGDPHGWRDRAACAGHPDPDVFTESRQGVIPVEALRVCVDCPVREECLDYALALPPMDDLGVFGGTTVRTRSRVRTGRWSRGQAMARADDLARERTEAERLADEEPWLLGVAHG